VEVAPINQKAQSRHQNQKDNMGRAPCCDKANVKKGPWSPEEDAKLKSYIEKHGTGGNWIALPQKIGILYHFLSNPISKFFFFPSFIHYLCVITRQGLVQPTNTSNFLLEIQCQNYYKIMFQSKLSFGFGDSH